MKPVTQQEREEYQAIILELCAKYSIDPKIIKPGDIDRAIIRNRGKIAEARTYARRLGRAMRIHSDKQILEILEVLNGN